MWLIADLIYHFVEKIHVKNKPRNVVDECLINTKDIVVPPLFGALLFSLFRSFLLLHIAKIFSKMKLQQLKS